MTRNTILTHHVSEAHIARNNAARALHNKRVELVLADQAANRKRFIRSLSAVTLCAALCGVALSFVL